MSSNYIYIDPLYIINKNTFESIQDVSICSICTGVVIDAQQCSKCENCFCKFCIEIWLKKSNTCPYKCSDWSLKEASRVVKTILSKIYFKCPKNCNKQFKYGEIVTHSIKCSNHIVDCPTCGSKVPENIVSINRETISYIELKIENEILKRKIEKLENNFLDKNRNAKNNFFKKAATSNKEENNGGKLNECNTQNLFKENIYKEINTHLIQNKFFSKISLNNPSTLFIHDEHSIIKFRFLCCNKEYDCIECHNENEFHHYSKALSITCQNCFNISNEIYDSICSICEVSFLKDDYKVKLDVIKYKNSNKKQASNKDKISINTNANEDTLILNNNTPVKKTKINFKKK